jgi:hypothetical protein
MRVEYRRNMGIARGATKLLVLRGRSVVSALKKSSRSICGPSKARVSFRSAAINPTGDKRSRKWRRTQLMPRRARLAATIGACSFEGRAAAIVALRHQIRKRAPSGSTRCPSLAPMKPPRPVGAWSKNETSAWNCPAADHLTVKGCVGDAETAAAGLVVVFSPAAPVPCAAKSPRLSRTINKRAIVFTGANRSLTAQAWRANPCRESP